jgi:hypothetical protein
MHSQSGLQSSHRVEATYQSVKQNSATEAFHVEAPIMASSVRLEGAGNVSTRVRWTP